MMKRIIIILTVLLAGLQASAQKTTFLFPDFTEGRLVFFNQSKADLRLNFDTINQTLYYMQDDQLMELTNLKDVRTLTAGGREFVLHDGLLCEVVETGGRRILVNWKFRNVNKGSKGALGATTQSKVDVLWTNLDAGTIVPGQGRYAEMGEYALEIWQMKSDNTYFITVGEQDYRVRKLKDLYKAFPDVAPQLKAFAKENHLLMTSAEDSFKIFTELFRLLGD